MGGGRGRPAAQGRAEHTNTARTDHRHVGRSRRVPRRHVLAQRAQQGKGWRRVVEPPKAIRYLDAPPQQRRGVAALRAQVPHAHARAAVACLKKRARPRRGVAVQRLHAEARIAGAHQGVRNVRQVEVQARGGVKKAALAARHKAARNARQPAAQERAKQLKRGGTAQVLRR